MNLGPQVMPQTVSWLFRRVPSKNEPPAIISFSESPRTSAMATELIVVLPVQYHVLMFSTAKLEPDQIVNCETLRAPSL